MTSIRKVAIACTLAAATMFPLTASAQGGLPNQDTFFTFSQAVELPGTTLPAGTYLFALADGATNRHVVRVMSQDRTTLHATLLAIPNYTLDKASDEPQVRFMEGPETGPQAVKVWFYPGRTTGHEFLYPRSQARKLAARTGESVLTTKTEAPVVDTVADQDMTRVDRTGADAPVAVTAEAAPAEPVSAPVVVERVPEPAVAERTTEPVVTERAQTAPARTEAARVERAELPATASLLPLLALVGLGSLLGSRLLRARRVR